MPTYRVTVTLKPALLDPAGRAVADALRARGFEQVEDVRIGKVVDVTTSNGSAADIERMCRDLLSNPVIETYSVEDGR